MRDVSLSELERIGADAARREDTFQMDEDAFRLFFERTARQVWAYLSRMSGDPRLADDLLQAAGTVGDVHRPAGDGACARRERREENLCIRRRRGRRLGRSHECREQQ